VINARRACWIAMNNLIAHDRERTESTGRGRADLHVHTLYSDGGQSPEAVVRAAAGRVDVVGRRGGSTWWASPITTT
jgi:hypothetical protein